ncbi:uncharacterized protein LOC135157260 [Lytechinus pictus]|uniref:uncharacterized protein LOC135157260 n=1 Tax=Lytechinus pictus TaxID=7653 RepID=UPI0030B9F628
MYLRGVDIVSLVLIPSIVTSGGSGIARTPACDEIGVDRISEHMEYSGCYKHACYHTFTNFTTHRIDECTQSCKNESYEFAGLSAGNRCHCGYLTCSRYSKVCESSCGFPCLNSGRNTLTTCGGLGFIQVYKDDQFQFENREGEVPLVIPLFVPLVICLVVFVAAVMIHQLKTRRELLQSTTIPTYINAPWCFPAALQPSGGVQAIVPDEDPEVAATHRTQECHSSTVHPASASTGDTDTCQEISASPATCFDYGDAIDGIHQDLNGGQQSSCSQYQPVMTVQDDPLYLTCTCCDSKVSSPCLEHVEHGEENAYLVPDAQYY